MFDERQWIFQQVSAPAHKTKATQQQLENHVPEFICSVHWPSATDLNTLDSNLLSVLVDMVCTRCHHNLNSLKQALVETEDNFPVDVVRKTSDFSAVLEKMAAILHIVLQFVVHYIRNKFLKHFSNQISINFLKLNSLCHYLWQAQVYTLTNF